MARCGCGTAAGGCGCSVIAGTNTTVTGSGSQANPYVINSVTNCATVRGCLSAGCGITYNSGTGAVSASISPDANNSLQCRANGLYVAAGAATITAGCGFNGNGSAGSPLTLKSKAWPFACTQDSTTATGVYCDPATGQVHGDPPVRMAVFQNSENVTLATNVVVPAVADTTIRTLALDITNPDPCRQAQVMYWQDVDLDLDLPPNSGAMYGMDGDDMVYLGNQGNATVFRTHAQAGKMKYLTLAAGATTTITLNYTAGRGTGGASISRFQGTIRCFLFSIP